MKELAVEAMDGVDRDIDRGSGEFAFGDEMEKPALHLLGADQVGRLVMELCQINDVGGVGLDGSLREILKREELNEFLA